MQKIGLTVDEAAKGIHQLFQAIKKETKTTKEILSMEKLERFKMEALGFPSRAKRIIVHDNKTLLFANEFVKSVKVMRKEVADTFNPIIEKARKARDEALAQKRKYDEPLKESEKIIKLHIASYIEDQARIQREAEEEARKKEEERQKKEEKIIEDAKILEDSGKTEEAETMREDIPLPELIEEVPRPAVEGLTIKKILDTERINKLVTDSKGQIKIPGIEIFPLWMWKVIDRKLIPKSYYKSSISTRIEKAETINQGKSEDA